ncbi:MAG: class I SAM-dependent methyltransferase [Parachlamydiaceae bacterium]|nr:class I SAM-dependent methyltransferase [Parachlamydiaceae bacterium]
MSKKSMQYEKDEHGKEVLLKNGSLQVMMEWEKPYMEACINALKPAGDVLEIGFGLGYSANCIQKFKPKSHTIVECDPVVLEKAKAWAKTHPGVKIVEGTWQEKLDSLGKFDTIFFDDYSPLSNADIKELQTDSAEGKKLAAEANKAKDSLAAALKQFRGVKFSDEDLQDFSKQVLLKQGVTVDYVHSFIDDLETWGNIDSKQKEAFITQLNSQAKKLKTSPTQSWQQSKQIGDRFVIFAEACLDKHMKPHAKLSAYMGSPESKLKHPEFQKRILSRKDISYNENPISVSVPDNCSYFEGNKALVIVIEKK